jgi:hypothetical protein
MLVAEISKVIVVVKVNFVMTSAEMVTNFSCNRNRYVVTCFEMKFTISTMFEKKLS